MVVPMSQFSPRNLTILAVVAVVSFGLLYWPLNSTLAYAIGWTAVLTVVALVAMYFKSRRSS